MLENQPEIAAGLHMARAIHLYKGRSVVVPVAVQVVQHLFQIAAFGFKQLGATGDFTQADLVLGGNFALGLAFVEVFEQLPAESQGVDFAGRENLAEQHFHLFAVLGLGEKVNQFPGGGFHGDSPFDTAGCRRVHACFIQAPRQGGVAQLFPAATTGEKELDFDRPPIYLKGGRKCFCMTEHRKNPVERKGKSL